MKKNKSKFYQGAASIYVVVFTTLLLSVITISFICIILSESSQATSNELSQSAYDSALAGTEDAKVALMKYHDCLNRGFTANLSKTKDRDDCEETIKDMEQLMKEESCDVVSATLRRIVQKSSGAVIMDTVTDMSNNTGGKNTELAKTLDQAYTCIKIKKDIHDYSSTLDRENSSKVVPLRVDNIDKIKSMVIEWHSVNRKNQGVHYQDSDTTTLAEHDPANPFSPPTLKLELFQTDVIQTDAINKRDYFSLGYFYTNKDEPGNNNGGSTNRGFLFLKPVSQGTNITADEAVDQNGNSFAYSNDKAINTPVKVACDPNRDEYMCSSVIQLPRPFIGNERSQGATFIRVSSPYITPSTEFKIKLCEEANGKNCDGADFGGIQAVVDATGRASDFYRRVESRLELVDTNFPYPRHALNSKDGEFTKNFRITRNCWTENGTCTNYRDLPADGEGLQKY